MMTLSNHFLMELLVEMKLLSDVKFSYGLLVLAMRDIIDA